MSAFPPSTTVIVVYRLGWYGGAGARLVACLPGCNADEQGVVQPAPPIHAPSPDGPPIVANWRVTDTLQTDPRWTSGYYLVAKRC